MTSSLVSLSPAEGCLARQISYWIGISAEGKGGSTDQLGRGWTYLSADDLQGRVLDYDHIELSIPTIYRALKSLVAKGWFLREKLTSHRWYQVFHYTFGPNHPSILLKNGTDQNEQIEEVKKSGSELSLPSGSSTSKTIKPVAVAPKQKEQPEGIDREEVASQPLTSIQDSAPPELLQELKAIEANYRKQLESLKAPELSPVAVNEPPEVPRVPSAEHSKQDSGLEHRIHNPQLEQGTRRAHNPKVGNTWDRIRALASQFSASTVESVSPKAIITRSNQRLRVDDGITSPLR